MPPQVSIIIVSYSTRDVLRACLRSIAGNADVPHEVVVVDNASTDGTADMIRAEFPHVRLMANERNIGFSPANNLGMAQAQGEWIALLNPDTELLPGTLTAWLDAHRSHAAAISGPRLLNVDGSLQPSAWQVPGIRSALLELLGLHRMLRAHHYEESRFATSFQPGFISGAAMLFHRDWFARTGGLDPDLFWSEDADLCMRIRAMGGACWYFKGPAVMHIGGESAKRNPRRAISNQLLSRVKLARKHGGRVYAFVVGCLIAAHIASRIVAFGCIALLRPEPRADAYRHAAARFFRYVVLGDRSI